LDDLVTAWFAAQLSAATPPSRIADLGCGIGAVLLLLAWRFPAARCVGVEAQSLSVNLGLRSIALNGVGGRCEIRLGDLRDPGALPGGEVWDLVTGTPPYLPPGTATEPVRVQQGPCHIEHRGGIEAYCAAAARLMAPGARFVVCHAAPQAARAAAAAHAAGLAVEYRRDVIPRQGKEALFTVYSLRRAAETPAGAELSPLVVRDINGQRTDEFRSLREQMGIPP
jgi:tRNA1(Val) A37 N6-methylase TrmN6